MNPDDVLADVGGGTGLFSQLIWQKGMLKHPVLCVDPVSSMLKGTAQREGVIPVHMSGEEFVSSEYMKKYNVTKVACSFCVHYMGDISAFLDKITLFLPPGGKCTISFRTNPTIPYFSAAYNHFTSQKYSKKKAKVLEYSPKVPNVSMSILDRPLSYTIAKSLWYKMLRERFEEHLELFSDESIEEGIAELEETKFKNLKDNNHILFTDVCKMCVLSKGT